MTNNMWDLDFSGNTVKKFTPVNSGALNNLKLATGGKSDAMLSEKWQIKGEVHCEGRVEFHGVLDGSIESSGDLIIGEKAMVTASINADRIEILGRVVGDIEAKFQIIIGANASVTGNLTSPSVVIKDGANFEGLCRMKGKSR